MEKWNVSSVGTFGLPRLIFDGLEVVHPGASYIHWDSVYQLDAPRVKWQFKQIPLFELLMSFGLCSSPTYGGTYKVGVNYYGNQKRKGALHRTAST